MSKQLQRFTVATAFGLVLASGLACNGPTGDLARAGRPPAERAQLIKPGELGGNGAANRRRGFFDFWNEEIIREDRAVSTVFMGDSITELWDLHAYFRCSAEEAIENRGISGDLASIMVQRFAADVVQLRPRNVVILAGTNDVSHLAVQGKSQDEICTATLTALEAMIDQAQQAGIKVLMCSIIPTNSDYRMHSVNPTLRARINARLKEICAEKQCVYVDYAAALQDGDGALRKDVARDGLHPHWAGYEFMAQALKAAAKAHGLRL